MSTHQEYWDACLIMAWRNFENYGDAVEKFKSITGISPHEIDPPLLRIPDFCPYSTSIRNMTFAYLTAINNWLLNHSKEEDIKLLNKLKTSKYTTHKMIRPEKNLTNERYRLRKNKAIVEHEITKANKLARNKETDWRTTK